LVDKVQQLRGAPDISSFDSALHCARPFGHLTYIYE
jgi:hypothetical protein